VQDVEDEPLFAGRAAGIDIGKATVMVTVRVPSDTRKGRRQQETREFGTTRRELLALADWLRCWQVERAGMEATSDYWKPVYFLLEREGLNCVLYHASQVKGLPGRPKTDKLDSAWLAVITERGDLQGSFVPPEDIRRLRACTRYRRHLARERTAEKQRAEKLLEDAHLKLSSVLSDIHGVSGRAMLDAVIAGERDPKALAQLARARARAKIRELEEALDCAFLTPDHVWVLKAMLRRIDQLAADIAEVTARIGELCRPWEDKIARLCTIPGFSAVTAQDLIAEIGVDMSVFPTPGHLASWARQAPGVSESAGRRRRKSAGQGNPYLGGTLGETSAAATRTSSFLAAKFRRLVRHMPGPKAQRAIMRHQLVIVWHILSSPDAVYNDLGADYYERRTDASRRARSHVMAIERLGYKVTIEPAGPQGKGGTIPDERAS
jgi:transposase